jgi:energy-coupling factor transporter ATP-binding protein EcfA2
MRLREVTLLGYRSVSFLQFEAAPLTVLFGKNNSGKTNVLEAIYGVLAPEALSPESKGRTPARGVSHPDDLERVVGWVIVQLDADLPFDRKILDVRESIEPDDPYGEISVTLDQAAFISHHDEDASYTRSGFTFAELDRLLDRSDPQNVTAILYDLDYQLQRKPRARPLFLNWDIERFSERVVDELVESHVVGRHPFYAEYADPWIPDPSVSERLESFAALATRFLPDFLDGSIGAHVHVPNRWGEQVRLAITYRDRAADPGTERRIDDMNDIGALGSGTSRWVVVAVQIALQVIAQGDIQPGRPVVPDAPQNYSGYVLFLDEPEAHLHSSAVASIVRWCRARIDDGFNIVLATHHEQFLRMAGDDVALVHITRAAGDPSPTQARTLLSSAAPLLQGLAEETGMHPATVLSLHRAVLFVEGTLDVAVLQEFAGFSLEAAGVLVIPIGGTNNLYGLIDGEFAPRLGMKVGVLTDNTVVATMDDRAKRDQSHEERKLVRLLERFEETGATPPKLFGVPEDDLLCVLPADAIREHLNRAFPGWQELVDEWRAAKTAMPQAPRNWKAYAEITYGLPITKPEGVRSLVQALDLAGVELPSLRTAVDAIIDWARAS